MTIKDISVDAKQIVTIDFIDGDREATFFVTGSKLLEALKKVARPNSGTAVVSDYKEPTKIKVNFK